MYDEFILIFINVFIVLIVNYEIKLEVMNFLFG